MVRKGRVGKSCYSFFLAPTIPSLSTSQVAIGTAIGNDWTTTGQRLFREGVSLGIPAAKSGPRRHQVLDAKLADHPNRAAPISFVARRCGEGRGRGCTAGPLERARAGRPTGPGRDSWDRRPRRRTQDRAFTEVQTARRNGYAAEALAAINAWAVPDVGQEDESALYEHGVIMRGIARFPSAGVRFGGLSIVRHGCARRLGRRPSLARDRSSSEVLHGRDLNGGSVRPGCAPRVNHDPR